MTQPAAAFDRPASSSPGDAQQEGYSAAHARADHKHAREAADANLSSTAGSVAQIDVGDAASAGASTLGARVDHQHALPAPAAPVAVNNSSQSAGSATTVARSDHQHGVASPLTLPASNHGIELGSTSGANTPFLDFHSSGNVVDYDSRIIASGGSGSVGQGSLALLAAAGVSAGNMGVVQDTVATSQTTTSTTYTDLGTVGPTVTLTCGPTGKIAAEAKARANNGTNNSPALCGIELFDVTASSTTSAAQDDIAGQTMGLTGITGLFSISTGVVLFTGLTVGHSYRLRMKYRTAGGSTGTFASRALAAWNTFE